MDTIDNAMAQVAEKSDVAMLVSQIFGGIIGGCATKLVNDVIENVAPKPKDITTKIVYGIGSYALGGITGVMVADKMTKEMQETAGALLTLKATWNEVLKAVDEENTNTEEN